MSVNPEVNYNDLSCPQCGSSKCAWEENEDYETEGHEGFCVECGWVGNILDSGEYDKMEVV